MPSGTAPLSHKRADIITSIRESQAAAFRMRGELAERVRISREVIIQSRELMAKADHLLGGRTGLV